MMRSSWIITAAAVLMTAALVSGCSRKPEAETVPAVTETQETTTAQETTAVSGTTEASGATEAAGQAVDLTDRYHLLQGTVVKTAEDGSVFTLQADDGKNYDIKRADIGDVEVEIETDVQIAIAYIGKPVGRIGDVQLVVALPEQEEWTVYQETGTTVFNAMSSFTLKTDDNRELSLLKDNCPMEEGALTRDSGDRIMVAYVTSQGTNFPIEVRKGK